MSPVVVAKVGGSLFDLPDLRDRLLRWIASVPGHRILFVPGGGRLADAIRQFDRQHVLGEERAHWLALHVLSVNAHFVSNLIAAPVQPSPCQVDEAVAVLDPHSFSAETRASLIVRAGGDYRLGVAAAPKRTGLIS